MKCWNKLKTIQIDRLQDFLYKRTATFLYQFVDELEGWVVLRHVVLPEQTDWQQKHQLKDLRGT